MRQLLRRLFIDMSSVVSQPKSGVYIMNGHYLTRSNNDDAEVFERQLKKLSRFARFIGVEEAIELVRSGGALQVDETLMAFTFDDGFDDCFYSLAPILEEYNVNACFFVNPGFVDGNAKYQQRFTDEVVLTQGKQPMSWEQIKSLADRGFVIGNHTKDHIRLSAVSLEEAESQVVSAKQILEERLGAKCDYFAWPFGQYADVNTEVIDMLLKHHSEVFSGCDFVNYMSYDNRVFNRRHFEADWSVNEVKYFLAKKRVYCA